MLRLGRDPTLWKVLCYNHSTIEATRRLRELRNRGLHTVDAATTRSDGLLSLTEALDAYQNGDRVPHAITTHTASVRWSRALANWEPGYPEEDIDYYEEYIQRHAKVNASWKHFPGTNSESDVRTAVGVALLKPGDTCHSHVVCALDDGSVIIYDTASSTSTDAILGHSGPGLLAPGARTADDVHQMMTNDPSVETVSLDSHNNRGFFAVGNTLHEVDLQQLSLVSSKRYSLSAITALSSCDRGQPQIVGTTDSIHLHDPRDRSASQSYTSSRPELIAGPRLADHVTLAQPGPTSIMHDPVRSGSIWVAGRFTSMLQYSLRFFPRLESTLHSGARMSSMTSLPYSYIPRHLDLVDDPSCSISARAVRKSTPGWTAICAGVYKGKGSLELYSMSAANSAHDGEKYLNIQTASSSKLLSVASHGGRIVCSDGNGNLRWMERNGYSFVRSFNINEQNNQAASMAAESSQLFANGDEGHGEGDIVQKMLPFQVNLRSGHISEKLLLWTADGRVGKLSFGPTDTSQTEEFHDAVEVQAEKTSERARQDAERQYAMAMRRALKRNADEVRFVRGLGLGS